MAIGRSDSANTKWWKCMSGKWRLSARFWPTEWCDLSLLTVTYGEYRKRPFGFSSLMNKDHNKEVHPFRWNLSDLQKHFLSDNPTGWRAMKWSSDILKFHEIRSNGIKWKNEREFWIFWANAEAHDSGRELFRKHTISIGTSIRNFSEGDALDQELVWNFFLANLSTIQMNKTKEPKFKKITKSFNWLKLRTNLNRKRLASFGLSIELGTRLAKPREQ